MAGNACCCIVCLRQVPYRRQHPAELPPCVALDVQACSPASFGRGAQTVLDPAYRKALALPPERFALNMKLPTDGMLQVSSMPACMLWTGCLHPRTEPQCCSHFIDPVW